MVRTDDLLSTYKPVVEHLGVDHPVEPANKELPVLRGPASDTDRPRRVSRTSESGCGIDWLR